MSLDGSYFIITVLVKTYFTQIPFTFHRLSTIHSKNTLKVNMIFHHDHIHPVINHEQNKQSRTELQKQTMGA